MLQNQIKDPRFTVNNEDGTTTCGNGTLVVTLPTKEFEKIGRYGVFNDAMLKIGNKSEAQKLLAEAITHEEIYTFARQYIVVEYLEENCRYNLGEVLMRHFGGHRLSVGMQQDVDKAEQEASKIMKDPTRAKDYTTAALKKLEGDKAAEIKHRDAVGNTCSNWKIEIVGKMPEVIGMCRVGVKDTDSEEESLPAPGM